MTRTLGGSRRRPRLARAGAAGAAAALVLLVGACQEGDGTVTVGPSSTATAVGATGQDVPEQSSLVATDYVLTEGPETVGYTAGEVPEPGVEKPGNSGADDDVDIAQVAECLGIGADSFDKGDEFDEATGAEFTYDFGDFPTVSSEATVRPAATVAEHVEILENPDFASCFGAALEEQLVASGEGSDVTYEVVAVEAVEPPPGGNAAIRVSFGVHTQGQSFGFVLDGVFMFRGQVEAVVTFLNVDAPTPPGDVDLMTSQIDAKLDNQ